MRLFAERGVTDVLLDGGGGCWVVRGGAVEARENPFAAGDAAAEIDRLAIDLIAAGGRQLDPVSPFADVVLGAFRVHAALRSACSRQTQISVRFLGQRTVALDELKEFGTFDQSTLDGMRIMLGNRDNFLISGATGSGKTTLLRALMSECIGQRIITIEDLPELRLEGAVELVARRANIEGRGEVGLERLLIESLRMRPDRIVVGELRSTELLVLLQALNTGHSGSGATLHANDVDSVPDRLRAIGMAAGLVPEQIDRMVATSIRWLIHVEVRSGRRQIVAIGRLSLVDGKLVVETVRT
ncbi:MAG: hypothetical protein RL672_581 [Actinomycetota bacterium]